MLSGSYVFEVRLWKALSFIVNFEYTSFFQNHSLIFFDNLTHSFLTLAVHLCVTGCRETDSSKRIVTTAGSAHKIGLHILHIRNTIVSYHVHSMHLGNKEGTRIITRFNVRALYYVPNNRSNSTKIEL